MDQSRLRENIISLGLLQGANYILPLITVPYLVRTLGPEKFGLLAFSQAFIQYFILLTDYGFNLSATRLISIHRDDIKQRSQVFWATVWAKLVLMILSFFIMAAIVFTFERFRIHWPIYFISFLVVFGNVLFPIWYFQGMERMKFISALNILAKFVCVAAIFLFVQKEGDYLIAAGIQASGMVIGGGLGMYFVTKIGALQFVSPKISLFMDSFREGWHVFLSTAGVSLYVSSSVFILGILAGNTVVGYFSAAQKIIHAAQGLINPVSQAIYPRISSLAAQSRMEALDFIRKSLRWIASGTFAVSLALFLLAEQVVSVLLGSQFMNAVILVRIMAFLPFIVGLSNIFGIQTMITFGLKKQFSRILVSYGLLNIAMIIPLVVAWGATGAAISLIITEILITLTMALILHRNELNLYRLRVVKA